MEQNDIMSAQNVILEELKNEFGGVARAVGDLDTMASKKLKNSISDLSEEIGALMTTALAPMERGLSAFISRAADALAANRRLRDARTDIKGGGSAAQTLDELNKKLEVQRSVLKDAQAELAKFNTTTESAGKTMARSFVEGAQAAVATTEGMIASVKRSIGVTEEYVTAFEHASAAFSGFAASARDEFLPSNKTLEESLTETISELVVLRETMKNLPGAPKGLWNWPQEIRDAFSTITDLSLLLNELRKSEKDGNAALIAEQKAAENSIAVHEALASSMELEALGIISASDAMRYYIGYTEQAKIVTDEFGATVRGIMESTVQGALRDSNELFSAFGKFLVEGEEGYDALRAAAENWANSLLQRIPEFLFDMSWAAFKAGHFELGLGLLAASGAAALVSGIVGASIAPENDATSATATRSTAPVSSGTTSGGGGNNITVIVQGTVTSEDNLRTVIAGTVSDMQRGF